MEALCHPKLDEHDWLGVKTTEVLLIGFYSQVQTEWTFHASERKHIHAQCQKSEVGERQEVASLVRSCKARITALWPGALGSEVGGVSVWEFKAKTSGLLSGTHSLALITLTACCKEKTGRTFPLGALTCILLNIYLYKKCPVCLFELGWRFDILATSWFGHFSSTTSPLPSGQRP